MIKPTSKDAETELRQYRDKLEEMVALRSKELTLTNKQLANEIDERRKAEEALQKSEERYRTIFENNATATILLEPDMTISMANAKVQKLVGLPHEKFVNSSKIIDFITPLHRERIKLYHELRMRLETIDEDLARLQAGSVRLESGKQVLAANIAPLIVTVGGAPGLVAALRDASREAEVERLKNEFISTSAMNCARH